MKYKVIPFLLCPALVYGKNIAQISTYEDNYVLGTYTTDINQNFNVNDYLNLYLENHEMNNPEIGRFLPFRRTMNVAQCGVRHMIQKQRNIIQNQEI